MKAVLNVDGKQLEVTSISYYKGEVASVQTLDKSGVISTYYHESNNFYTEASLVTNLNEALEFPAIKEAVNAKFGELIDLLDDLQKDENDTLTHFAVNALDIESDPFGELSLKSKQDEFKRKQQRVMGVIDTIEEVKMFVEGLHANDDNATAVEA